MKTSVTPIYHHAQRGLSLVELLVAMGLGILLISGISQVFIASSQSYRMQQDLGRIQENIRFSHEFLSRDIRMAGYLGCISVQKGKLTNLLRDQSQFDWNMGEAIQGINNYGTSTATSIETGVSAESLGIKTGTDVLILRGPAGDGLNILSDVNSAQMKVGYTGTNSCGSSTGGSGLCAGDILLAANCVDEAVLFQATNIIAQETQSRVEVVHSLSGTYTPGNIKPAWGNDINERFGKGSEIVKYQTVIYFIGTGTSGEPTLMKRTGPSGTPDQLIEGIEDMQIEYGVDNNSGIMDYFVDEYKNATQVTTANEWSRVISTRITLLMRGTQSVLEQNETKSISGGITIAADRRLRQITTFTTALRSRTK